MKARERESGNEGEKLEKETIRIPRPIYHKEKEEYRKSHGLHEEQSISGS